MSVVSFPKTTVQVTGAQTEVAAEAQRVLFVGQMTASGTATAGAVNSNIQNDSSWDTLFGENSMLAAMLRAARAVNPLTQFDAIALDDAGAGTASTGSIAVSGTATEAGSLTVVVGSERNHTLSVAVTSGDTATVVGDAIEAAITADTKAPVTAANTTGTVALTAVHKGTLGDAIGVEVQGSVAGLTVTVTGMSGGATDPTLTGVFDVVGETRYQGVVWPYADAVTELTSFLDNRFNVSDDVLDGVGFTTKQDTLANHLTALGSLNSFLVRVCTKTVSETLFKGPDLFELPYVASSLVGALRGLKLTEGSAIASLNVGLSGRDANGGPALASRPYANTPVTELLPIKQARGFTKVEVGQLNDAGGAVVGNNTAGNTVLLGQLVTTRTTDAAGNPDDSFKYLNYVDTASNIREYYWNNLRARYSQSRLTDGDLVPGRPMANRASIEATCVEFYDTLSGADFALTRAGEANRKFYANNLIVSLDLQTGKVTITMVTPIVTQLREIAATIQIAFDVEG